MRWPWDAAPRPGPSPSGQTGFATFQPNTLYAAGAVILQAGILYARVTLGTSGASFAADAANWTALGSSSELGYAQITSNVALAAGLADVAGLSLTVTVGSRPIKLIFDAQSLQISAATNFAVVQIMEGATELAGAQVGVGATNSIYPGHREVRLSPSAGAHTYKVQAGVNGSAGANDRIVASATSPAFFQALQL